MKRMAAVLIVAVLIASSARATSIGPPINVPTSGVVVTVQAGSRPYWGNLEGAALSLYVVDGELTVDFGSKRESTYRSGETVVLKPADWPYYVENRGRVPLTLVVIVLGRE